MLASLDVRRWRELRAGLIALAIGLGLLDGCPLPTNGAERSIAQQRLGGDAARTIDRVERARSWLLRPVRPAAELLGLRQRWKLFAGADRHRYRIAIEVRVEGETAWRLRYRPHDGDHAWLAAAIEYRRMRGAWNPHSTYGARAGYARFADWVADQAFAQDARTVEVRVRMEKIVIGDHGDYRGTGEDAYTIVRRRADRAALRAPR